MKSIRDWYAFVTALEQLDQKRTCRECKREGKTKTEGRNPNILGVTEPHSPNVATLIFWWPPPPVPIAPFIFVTMCNPNPQLGRPITKSHSWALFRLRQNVGPVCLTILPTVSDTLSPRCSSRNCHWRVNNSSHEFF